MLENEVLKSISIYQEENSGRLEVVPKWRISLIVLSIKYH
jgi:hypothetical protein